MRDIIPKKCLACGKKIPTKREGWKSPLGAYHYSRLKYCSLSCSSFKRNKTEEKWGRKSKKPDIEILNRLWSKTKSYKVMSQTLGVSYSAIKNWMGNQKYLIHPGLLYMGEPDNRGCKKEIDWKAIEEFKKRQAEKGNGEKVFNSRAEYLKDYYIKNKEKKRLYYKERYKKKKASFA